MVRLEIEAAGRTYGNDFRVTTYGEPHGGGVGCIIDGCPPRLPLAKVEMQVEFHRRQYLQVHLQRRITRKLKQQHPEYFSWDWLGLVLGLILATIVGVGLHFGARLFTKDVHVLHLISRGIPFVAATQPINALAFVFDGINFGASDFAYSAYSMPNCIFDIKHILTEAQNRWLRPAEICEILRNYQKFQIASQPPNRPISGSLFLFDRKVLRYFRKDGHNWRKKKDGKTVKEAHEKLKAQRGALFCFILPSGT
nr:calmodulin-binding transcription activator 2 [Quercus suber]